VKFKLDENFGNRTESLFRSYGHDVETVRQEQMSGASDPVIYAVCQDESRCLVTLDLDFADVIRFPPHLCGGIAVIRVPKNPSLALLELLVRQLLAALEKEPLKNRLWIVEVGRIRVHQDTDPEL
jgi:predicted nuclease of predicted toxin-antitoxin system